jgi:branched-chain amino acid transport system substrate-binding protein
MRVQGRGSALLIAGLAVVVLTAVSAGTVNAAAGRKVVKVGIAGSFSGVTAFYGQQAQQGAELAAAQLNASQKKYTFSVVTADDQCSPDGGAAAYGSLIDTQHVSVILGSPCSAATLGGMPVLLQGRVPDVVVSSTNPQITAAGNPWVWRVNLDDATMAEVYSGYLAKQGISKLATLAPNNAYGQGAVQAYQQWLPAKGISLVTSQYYTQGGGDFRSQLSAIQSSGAQAMLCVCAHQDAAVMMRQFDELGLTIKVYARGDVVSTAFQQAAGDERLGDGIQEANNWDPTYQSYPQFRQAFVKKYGSDPQSYAVQAWLGMNVIAQAVQKGGGGLAMQIERGLSKTAWNSPIGPIRFDAHHQAHHNMYILAFKNGRIVRLQTIQISKTIQNAVAQGPKKHKKVAKKK